MYKYIEKVVNFLYSLQLLPLRLLGASIGKDVKVFGKFFVAGHPKNLTIGNNVTINREVFLNCRDKLVIGDGCRLSSYAKIYTTSLTVDLIPRKHTHAPTILEDNVWIASNALVGQGVIIGKNSAIAASSVVLENVPSNSFYGGIPAKKLRDISIK